MKNKMVNLKTVLENIEQDKVSREHQLCKKDAECCSIRALHDHQSIVYSRVETSERPDFLIDGHIGIEMVSCYPHNYGKGVKSVHTDACLNKVSVDYKKMLDGLGQHLFVSVDYKSDVYEKKIDVSMTQFAKEVIDELEEVQYDIEHYDFKWILGASFYPCSLSN